MHLVVVPLKRELKLLQEALQSRGHKLQPTSFQGKIFTQVKGQNLMLTRGGMGKVKQALAIQWWVLHKPGITSIVSVGSAGAIDESITPGDAVIADLIVEYDGHEAFGMESLPCDSPLYSAWLSHDQGVHRGAIASGDEVIRTTQRKREIKNKTQALCVAFEGAGAIQAAHSLGLPYGELRGISDSANESINEDFENHLKAAMDRCAQVLSAGFSS